MIVLAGASASGKTEVAKLLAKKYGITKVITTTTRQIRNNEENGRDYFFVSKKQFEQMLRDGEFVEYTLFNENMYGSTKDQIADNKCIVIDPVGLKSYIALKDKYKIVTFFLECDEVTRKERMIFRGDDMDKIDSRIAHDRIAFAKENLAPVDHIIDSSISQTVENVTDNIYHLYLEDIKK